MKIYPNMKKTLIYFSLLSIGLLFLFYLTFDGSFTWPLPSKDYIIFAGWLVITVIYFVITLRGGYYILEKSGLRQKQLNKDLMYEYKRIIYINDEWSRKNGMLLFVTDRGDAKYLILDKKQILLDEMLKRCSKLMTREEVSNKFPNLKF